MNKRTKEGEYWDELLKRELKADREEERLQYAKEVQPFIITRLGRQYEAYDWVYIKGFHQKTAAKMMGISEAAVCKLLKKFLKKYPELEPCPEDSKSFVYLSGEKPKK